MRYKVIGLLLILLILATFSACHPDAVYYGTFDSSSYEDQIDNFARINDYKERYIPGIQDYGEASDWEEVVKILSREWDFYGTQYIRGVWFDDQADVWLFYICMTDSDCDGDGALLIRGEDGLLMSWFTPSYEKEFEAMSLSDLSKAK